MRLQTFEMLSKKLLPVLTFKKEMRNVKAQGKKKKRGWQEEIPSCWVSETAED